MTLENKAPKEETLADIAAEIEATETPEVETEAPETEAAPVQAFNAVGAFATLFEVLGNLIATRAGVSALDDAEVMALAKGAQGVLDHYPIQMDAKAAAWIGLGMTAVAVATPRVMEYREKAAATIEQEAAENVAA